MNSDQEKKVLATLYDRLYDALTYAPGADKQPTFDRATTFLQMTKFDVLRPEDFRNAQSSANPKGDPKSTFAISEMVDVAPTVSAEWSDSTKKVSQTYKGIVDNANANNADDPAQKAIYDKAFNFLTLTTSIEGFDGTATVTYSPSAIAAAYDTNQTAYEDAVKEYRTAYNNFDLDKLEDQNKFQAEAPSLQTKIDQAWNKWVREGKQNVEKAQNALRTTINNAMAAAIIQAQDAMRADRAFTALGQSGEKVYPAYVMPTNWCEPTCRGAKLTLSNKFLATSVSAEASEYSRHSQGLFWTATGSESRNKKSDFSSMQTDEFELEAELITVRIRRPWLNSIVFSMSDWYARGLPKGRISNGGLKGNETSTLPLIPTAFIVAKDVRIKAAFTSQQTSHIESENSSEDKWGWGWGPFSGGGSYAHSRSADDKFQSTYENGVLKLPGLQVIAWVSTIVPVCPPKDDPAIAVGA
jgi:hypothetical protein